MITCFDNLFLYDSNEITDITLLFSISIKILEGKNSNRKRHLMATYRREV